MMRVAIVVAALLSASVGGVPQAGVAKVSVHVSAEDARDTPVAGLDAAAFSIALDGAPHRIDSVTAATAPLSILLLLDGSPSMKDHGSVEGVATKFVATLGRDDRVRTGVFADRILFSQAFTTARGSFRMTPSGMVVLRERTVHGGSPVWDAIYQSVDLLSGERNRRVLLVFTDGRASGNWYGLEEVANFSVDEGVAVYALAPFAVRGIRQAGEMVAMIRPAANLDRLTQYTGGMLIGGYDQRVEPFPRLQALGTNLRSGYTLTFNAPADGRRHRLDVRSNLTAVRLRAPMAFRAPSSR